MIINIRFQILTIISIVVIYTTVFFIFIKFDNTVPFEGDELFFQSIAVNFAKGHGFPKVGGIENFENYKFSFKNVNKPYPSIFLFKNSGSSYSFSKQPIYPLFIGLIYKLVGINPVVIKWMQLLMFIFVAAFLPWLGYKFWQKTGYYSGLIASPFFIFLNYYYSRVLYTEPLIVFTIFLIISGYINNKENQNYLSAIILGIILGISLLLKGSLIFIPFLIFLYLIIIYKKNKNKKMLFNAILIMSFMLFIIMPWSIYANIKNRDNVNNAKRSIEILSDKKLSYEYKKEFIDSSALIYVNPRIYPPFLATASIVKDVLLSNKIPPEEVILYKDNSTVEEKIVLQKFYLQSNRFIVFSNQSSMLMFDGNCEFYPNRTGIEGSNGGGNVIWCRKTNCSYYHDNMEDKPVLLRVLNFYYHFPNHIFKIFAYKLFLGIFRMMFLWVILYLFFLETLKFFLRKFFRNKVIYTLLALSGIFYLVFVFNPPVPGRDSVLFYSIIVTLVLFIIIVNLKNRFKNISFQAPEIFYIIFINFILISIIIFGFERQNNVINFMLTLSAFHYFLKFSGSSCQSF